MTRIHFALLAVVSTLAVLSQAAPAGSAAEAAKPKTSSSGTQTDSPSSNSQGTQTDTASSSSGGVSRGDLASAFAGVTGVATGATALGVAADKCAQGSNCRRANTAKADAKPSSGSGVTATDAAKATGDYGKIGGGALALAAGGLTAADYFGNSSKRSEPEPAHVVYYVREVN